MEEWRDVVGYEGLYIVSSLGRIKSADTMVPHWRGGMRRKYGRIMKATSNTLYQLINLSKDSKATMTPVHRVVAAAFIGPADGLQVNHINGIKTDNRAVNLEYTTAHENILHAIRIGLRNQQGSRNHKAVLSESEVNAIRSRLNAGDSARSIAMAYGVQTACIYKIKTGRTWRHLAA